MQKPCCTVRVRRVRYTIWLHVSSRLMTDKSPLSSECCTVRVMTVRYTTAACVFKADDRRVSQAVRVMTVRYTTAAYVFKAEDC